MAKPGDPFDALSDLDVDGVRYRYARLAALEEQGLCKLGGMPVSIQVLLESVLRNVDAHTITEDDVKAAASWAPEPPQVEIPFMPSRVLMQDFTGVPAVADLASMRDAAARHGGDPDAVNPLVPSDLVVDHSIQVDAFAVRDAFEKNLDFEYQRNGERYQFLKWAQQAFRNFRVVPPGTGICHQVNLEYLASVVHDRDERGARWAYPDTLVGMDSHTTMVGGIGVVGWGVGGIEAEAVMLGQPYFMKLPEVIGFRLEGELPEGSTATDLVLFITEQLRKVGAVDKFVEFHGPGVRHLTAQDRATISNMAPEQGSTISFFPVDEATVEYLKLTGRKPAHVRLVEAYARAQGLWGGARKRYSKELTLDLATVEPSLSGPSRPQDRVPLAGAHRRFRETLEKLVRHDGGPAPNHRAVERLVGEGGSNSTVLVEPTSQRRSTRVSWRGHEFELGHGSVVISAITSCTNTSNPSVMLGAGILARKAIERGLEVPPWVKTSLAPGSRVVTDYLANAGLLDDLEKLGYGVVAYGCTTCIGNAGPLPEPIEKAIKENELVVASVLSGNRNFEARIHPAVRANYLASPPLVVAYGLAGTVSKDLEKEPLGLGRDGQPVYLRDVWPSLKEIRDAMKAALDPELYRKKYAEVFEGDARWKGMRVPGGTTYEWTTTSTYIRNPPYFEDFPKNPSPPRDIEGARVLALLGDSVTTDHISPAGRIDEKGPAGSWLIAQGVKKGDFNSYGSRRGNHEVMIRGTFGNVRIKNLLVPGVEGGVTVHHPTGERVSIYEAAQRYRQERTPLLVLAGGEYGSGSSRDWAAKGTLLLGVRAVLAESYERIHRSNLIGMGVLPLEFAQGESPKTLGLDGTETFTVTGIAKGLKPRGRVTVAAKDGDGAVKSFEAVVRLDTETELDYFRHGGILPAVLRRLLAAS